MLVPSIPFGHRVVVTQGYNIQRDCEHGEWGKGVEEGTRNGGVRLYKFI